MQAQRVHLPLPPMVKLLGWPDRAACVRAWADFAQDPMARTRTLTLTLTLTRTLTLTLTLTLTKP